MAAPRVPLLSALLLAACAPALSPPPDATVTDGAADAPALDASAPDAVPVDPLVAARPFHLQVRGTDPTRPAPLLVMLHGYAASAAIEETYFQLGPEAARRGYLYATPDGTFDSQTRRFWNATDACCNFDHRALDDVAYLDALIDNVASRYPVDRRRVFVLGHSNGAFLSHRYACDRADRVAGIVALAGMQWLDGARCRPSRRVPVLQVHGTMDEVISYTGGNVGMGNAADFPSVDTTLARWAGYNGCTGARETLSTRLDLDIGLAGEDTRMERTLGCPADGTVELWAIEGGRHVPALDPMWAPRIFDWLDARPSR